MNSVNARYNCSIDAAMSVIEGRWKGTIICMLYINGKLRFSELQKMIGEITSRILSKQLKELKADGMIARMVIPDNRVKVEYSLTQKGISIVPVLRSLAEWGAMHQCIQVILPKVTVGSGSACDVVESVRNRYLAPPMVQHIPFPHFCALPLTLLYNLIDGWTEPVIEPAQSFFTMILLPIYSNT